MTTYTIEVIRDGNPILCEDDLTMAMMTQGGGDRYIDQEPDGSFTITTEYPIEDEAELRAQIEELDGLSMCEVKISVRRS